MAASKQVHSSQGHRSASSPDLSHLSTPKFPHSAAALQVSSLHGHRLRSLSHDSTRKLSADLAAAAKVDSSTHKPSRPSSHRRTSK